MMHNSRSWTSLLSLSLLLLPAARCGATTVSEDGKPAVSIVLAADASPAERTAAQELADYLAKATGGQFAVIRETDSANAGPAIRVGPTAAAKQCGLDPSGWAPERWAVRTVGTDIVLVGGRPRGTLYAVYRFLEEVVGVRWWNPWEEHVPQRPTLNVEPLDVVGEPRFRYRDIYELYARDEGRFAARSRLNRQGDAPIAMAFGGGEDYGPPYHCHTFFRYLRPEDHFAKHPEWFSLIDGKRQSTYDAQLCLTNPEVREFMIERLRGFIEQARAEAEKSGRPMPRDFEISQNDANDGMCRCPKCQAIVDREGSQAGPLFDFLNFIADAVRDQYPDIRIGTLVYLATEVPPKTIRARDNIVIRLTDTNSNVVQPITHPDNHLLVDRVAAWGQVCKTLRIWDYAVTYTPPLGLPLPTVHTYPIDYRYFAEHKVEGLLTEHEYPVLGDMRDLKLWMMMKLLEDPYRDYNALLRDFTDGFYGKAGPIVRNYLAELQSAAESTNSGVTWLPILSQYRYLTLEFVVKAQAGFDEAERLVSGNAVLERRVRHARLPVDRACIALWAKLMRQWTLRDGKPEQMPLNREQIAARCLGTMQAQIDLRFPEEQQADQRKQAEAELAAMLARPAYVPAPQRFRDLPRERVFDFVPADASNALDQAKRVADSDAECGMTDRLELSDDEVERYKLPMPWGVFDPISKGNTIGSIGPSDVVGPGYHWYKLGPSPAARSAYLWFFWSWVIQFPVEADPDRPDKQFEFWARIKFEGPGFPHGNPNQKNAISIERVVQIEVPSGAAAAQK